LAKLARGDFEYLDPELIAKYHLYLSFSGGPILDYLEEHFRSPAARALYCSVDTDIYYPEKKETQWQMGYLGTYSKDRQPTLTELLNKPAGQFPDKSFVVAGPQYPENYPWAKNVERIAHLPPAAHRDFYNAQKFTLNVTRKDMIDAGYSPSVRLFEAAACGVPIISDFWNGLDSIFDIGQEILVAGTSRDVAAIFDSIDAEQRKKMGERARAKVLRYHTAKARAKELEGYVMEVLQSTRVQNTDYL
jgi:spore maturation protein CgeB